MAAFLSNIMRPYPALKRIGDFVLFIARRLYRDHCAQTAASLTYTSLLAFIPFLVVGFAMLREFPVFPELVNSLQAAILHVFTPDTGEGVKQYIQTIVNKGAKLPVLSFIALIMTAVMMLYTVDDTLNRIWQGDYKRRTLFSFVVYLVVVMSGPLLLGSSLAITTYLVSRSVLMDGAGGFHWLASVPWLVTFIAFTALYRWVPNTTIQWRYAVSGGLVAMLLFELAKWGFTLYIRWVPTYGLLYGALAAIPLTLVWIYLSWLVVLIGAETARCLAIYKRETGQTDLYARQLLGYFLLNSEAGLSIDQLAAGAYQGKRRLLKILQRLTKAGLVQEFPAGRYGLTAKSAAMSIAVLTAELAEQLKLIEN